MLEERVVGKEKLFLHPKLLELLTQEENDFVPYGEPTYNSDGRWRAYSYEDLVARDKASLDIFWLKDESLSESDNLPSPDVIALEIVEDLEAALAQFREIAGDLNGNGG